MPDVTRAPVQCVDCGVEFVPVPPRPFRRCPGCKQAWSREYQRLRRISHPRLSTASDSKPCRACGTPVPRSGKVYAWYCSEGCKPRCTVEGCDGPQRKRKLCAGHYSQWNRTGTVLPFTYKWSVSGTCLACGEPAGDQRRQFCSSACAVHWGKYGGKPPASTTCIHCHQLIDLGKQVNGRRRRADTKMCSRCKAGLRKYDGMSVNILASRDGTTCALCGEPVDLSKRAPHPGCPSVDHRIPRARGGTNDPANLQLAHLVCNIIKHDTMPQPA